MVPAEYIIITVRNARQCTAEQLHIQHRGVFVQPFRDLLLLNNEQFNLKIPRHRQFRWQFSVVTVHRSLAAPSTTKFTEAETYIYVQFRLDGRQYAERQKQMRINTYNSPLQLCPGQNIDCVPIILQNKLL